MKSDIELREDVIEEIRWDPQLTRIASQIGVAVKDEVVTLSGVVEHYYQRLAAEKAAQRVAGVKVVALDIDVKGIVSHDTKSDTEIAEAVRNALTWHSAVNEDLINIKVDSGWIFLDGTVHWEYERRAAEKAVEHLVGVKGVVNRVRIKTQVIDPVEIRGAIRAAFHRHASVDSSNISVEVTGSSVKLTGKVRSWAEKKDAEDVSRSMPGITDVDNQLEISSEIFVNA
jgi:osmotically-inducible protein OsmY